MKNRVKNLIQQLCLSQTKLLESRFVAPSIPRAQLRTRVDGLVYSFRCSEEVEGWGVFRPLDERRAEWVGAAEPAAIEAYLKVWRACELRLIRLLQGSTWLAYPIHSDLLDRLAVIHLVDRGAPWGAVRGRFDGQNLWWDGLARAADPRLEEALLRAVGDDIVPAELRIPGTTPGDRSAYSVEFLRRHPEWSTSPGGQADPPGETLPTPTEQRLGAALARGGGRLRTFTEQGQAWLVHWIDSQGETHSSVIAKSDLGVVSAGVCLSGEDNKFDLTSLVGVVEGFE